jgi:glyoxylase-like metal-dependent hydrolase (beta-lactamase superfamily II)
VLRDRNRDVTLEARSTEHLPGSRGCALKRDEAFHIVSDLRRPRPRLVGCDTDVDDGLIAAGYRSVLNVRSVARHQVMRLGFFSKQPGAYDPDDVSTAQHIAHYVAVAVAHEQLAAAEQKRAEGRGRTQRLDERVRTLADKGGAVSGRSRMIGRSDEWQRVLAKALRVAPTETTFTARAVTISATHPRQIGACMELAVCSAAISLSFLVACPFAFAASQHAVSIKVFTSEDDQFWTNSVMIEGEHEVMLVDAQLTRTDAERVLREIKETDKPLSLIYITHEHADHFLGLEVFKEAYPSVRIIAASAVLPRIRKVYQEKIDKWKQLLGSDAATHVVPIEPFDGDTITFEGSHIEVLKHVQGDTDENTMLWIPEQGILVGGDVVFNDMHVYTAETDSQVRRKWLNSLNKIRELKPLIVIPGHGIAGASLDASTAVDFTETYLLAFDEELTKAKEPASLVNAMKKRFPSAELFLAIERGATANVKP